MQLVGFVDALTDYFSEATFALHGIPLDLLGTYVHVVQQLNFNMVIFFVLLM